MRESLFRGGGNNVTRGWIVDAAEKIKPPAPAVRLTAVDEMILDCIDNHGSVKSQTDLLDKLAEDGEIASEGSIKLRLAELKARGVLVPVKGDRGYKRA
ncbi:hypothetical protein Pla175_05570 [Pirellulimonas nuda]|uniref:Uncharacterized protein n=1 Tax=Pirellulimonas nuda TaxID=2528009 RepID=A0A518D6U9_9BACT|nr:hypothetical protein Pla175_05570 [Pirellulimonas nuda]